MAVQCHVILFVLFTSTALGGSKACKIQIHFIVCPYLLCTLSLELVNKVGLFTLWGKKLNLDILL
jgi:hypothetical protein